MGLPEKKPFISPEEYLLAERVAFEKSEYFQGEVFAMSGATKEHTLIVGNILTETKNFLKGKACNSYSNDLRVLVESNGLYTYPDIVIVCGKEEYYDQTLDTLLNPTIIIEVLSASTRDYDRGSKFMLYRGITSLKEYITKSSLNFHAERNILNEDKSWTLSETSDPYGKLEIQSLGLELKMEDIYYNLLLDKELKRLVHKTN